MRIATYNLNGINGRLPVLLRWLKEYQPDIACLQELRAPDEKFPADAIQNAGYSAIWQGKRAGTVWPFFRGAAHPWKYAVDFQATPMISRAATLKLRLVALR